MSARTIAWALHRRRVALILIHIHDVAVIGLVIR